MKVLFLLFPLTFVLSSCQLHQQSRKSDALQDFIETSHFKADVELADAENHMFAVTPTLSVRPMATHNNLYLADGTLVFEGRRAKYNQLVQVNPDGSVKTVSDFSGNPYGTYIGFTPSAIYRINRATGQVTKYPRNGLADAGMDTSSQLDELDRVMNNALGDGL